MAAITVTPGVSVTAVLITAVADPSSVIAPGGAATDAPTAITPAVTATPPSPTAAPTATPLASATARPAPTATTAPPPISTRTPAVDQAAVARGKAIFLSPVGCAQCHTINGLSTGDQGPNLTHIAGQPYDGLPNDPAFLRRWITNPQAIRPGTLMPDLGLTPAQVSDLVAFLETMR